MASLVKSTIALSAALMLGRLLGFLREVLLAGRVGVSAEADIAVVVLTLPEFVISVLLAGGFSAALVPALRRQDGEGRLALFRFVGTVSVLVGIALAAGIALAPGLVFAALAPGLEPGTTAPYHTAIRLVALCVPLGALAGVLGAFLNARDQFFVVGFGTVIYNIVLCVVRKFDAALRRKIQKGVFIF